MRALPEPIPIPWTMKPLASAETKLEYLDDGRMRCSIVHDVLHGVTPEMLVFWFKNMRGTLELEGKSYPRHRVWHEFERVAGGARYRNSLTVGLPLPRRLGAWNRPLSARACSMPG